MTPFPSAEQLRRVAREVRKHSLTSAYTHKVGHIGSEFSVTDILVSLYCAVMEREPTADRARVVSDRLVLSKGHAVGALYGTLVAAGILEPTWRQALERTGATVPGHPVAGSVPGIDATTGSLGHGLPVGVGMALATQMGGSSSRTFVVLGDGEMQEGSNWEAIMLAAQLRLSRLVAVVDANGLQQGARVSDINEVEPLTSKFEAFGWTCRQVNGHDFDELVGALAAPTEQPGGGAPTVVIARTVKGYPVSFMMNVSAWHHKIPNEDEFQRAIEELGGGGAEDV